ncbi:MAG: hypothetical protein AAF724_11945 [Pseudomonadota bacterium]
MAKDQDKSLTLNDEDIVTSSRLSRRSLLTVAGAGLGSVALAACSDREEATEDDPDTDGDSDS